MYVQRSGLITPNVDCHVAALLAMTGSVGLPRCYAHRNDEEFWIVTVQSNSQ